MKKLNGLNLGKSLGRDEMKNISGGFMPYCTCGSGGAVLTYCDCQSFCASTCPQY
ncbi:MAG: hypothetical protein QM535_19095 [Limnohabitans sp.]|nr:hypothetical protein [Limnohabitans sp.]